jgi:hypothetical protein
MSGSWPLGTSLQLPFLPARLQLLQVPVHVELQHTLSTQWPEAQALSFVPQDAPRGRLLTHLLPTHLKVPVQSESVVQDVLHALPATSHA